MMARVGSGLPRCLPSTRRVCTFAYKNRFKDRPERDKRELSLGKVDDPDGFGMGHLPLTRAASAA